MPTKWRPSRRVTSTRSVRGQAGECSVREDQGISTVQDDSDCPKQGSEKPDSDGSAVGKHTVKVFDQTGDARQEHPATGS